MVKQSLDFQLPYCPECEDPMLKCLYNFLDGHQLGLSILTYITVILGSAYDTVSSRADHIDELVPYIDNELFIFTT